MKNRVMMFYDLENFRQGLLKRDSERFYEFGRVQYTIIKLLKNIIKIDCDNSDIVRTYVYTGEYTKEIINKIKQEKDKQKFLDKITKNYEGQQKFLKKARQFNFFEMRTYPLKYENGRIFQKGVDVQIAVDFVTHAFRDNFDVAVICSGDIDLLESLKIVKSLGKKVIVMSHPKVTAINMRKEADFYLDISKLKDEELNEFSRKFTEHDDT